MAATLKFALVTPESVLFEGEVVSVSLRSGLGDVAFYANHEPFIGTVVPCVLKFVDEEGHVALAGVYGGFVRVADNKVSVVAPVATMTDDDESVVISQIQEFLGSLTEA